MSLTPEQRALRAKLAAHSLHAKVADPTAHTAPARKAFLDRFEREVDPDGTLPEAERHRRAKHARKAHFTRMSLAARQAPQGGGVMRPPSLRALEATPAGSWSSGKERDRLIDARHVVEVTRREQGLPPVVEDDQAIERVADMLRPTAGSAE